METFKKFIEVQMKMTSAHAKTVVQNFPPLHSQVRRLTVKSFVKWHEELKSVHP